MKRVKSENRHVKYSGLFERSNSVIPKHIPDVFRENLGRKIEFLPMRSSKVNDCRFYTLLMTRVAMRGKLAGSEKYVLCDSS